MRAISVGVLLLTACAPALALAAGEATERSQPIASSGSPAAPATGDDARSDTVIRCDATACGATDTPGKPQLRTAIRKAPWLGLSGPPVVSMGERRLGLRLLHGLYATVGLVPTRPLLDPVPADVSATDRVRVGLGCMVQF